MFQKEFNPPTKMGMAIYKARIFYKEPRDDLPDIIEACAYRYDRPKSTMDIEELTLFYYAQFENMRVEGQGLKVYIDPDDLLIILDLDSGQTTVVDMQYVLTVRTETCKRILPEEENDE